MTKILSLVLLAILFLPEKIPSLEAGMTMYSARTGKSLACNGRRYNTTEEWVALPTEWFLGGTVDCGDKVYICLPDGY